MIRRWAPLLLWLTIQILTLAIGAMRVPLSARAGAELQNLALPEMVVVQVALGTLLFPMLMAEGSGLVAAMSALPFLQLAGFLTATPSARVWGLALAIMVWFAGLWMWRVALACEKNHLIGVAVLGGLVIGLPLANYLVREFAEPDQAAVQIPQMLNPLKSLLSDSARYPIGPAAFAPPMILLLSGTLAVGLRSKFPTRQVIHKLLHRSTVEKAGS